MMPDTLTPRERVFRVIRLNPAEAHALGLHAPDETPELEPSIDYPYPVGEDTAPFVPVAARPEIPRPAPVTSTDVALAVVCLIGAAAFGMAFAAALVALAERMATGG